MRTPASHIHLAARCALGHLGPRSGPAVAPLRSCVIAPRGRGSGRCAARRSVFDVHAQTAARCPAAWKQVHRAPAQLAHGIGQHDGRPAGTRTGQRRPSWCGRSSCPTKRTSSNRTRRCRSSVRSACEEIGGGQRRRPPAYLSPKTRRQTWRSRTSTRENTASRKSAPVNLQDENVQRVKFACENVLLEKSQPAERDVGHHGPVEVAARVRAPLHARLGQLEQGEVGALDRISRDPHVRDARVAAACARDPFGKARRPPQGARGWPDRPPGAAGKVRLFENDGRARELLSHGATRTRSPAMIAKPPLGETRRAALEGNRGISRARPDTGASPPPDTRAARRRRRASRRSAAETVSAAPSPNACAGSATDGRRRPTGERPATTNPSCS